MTFVDFGFRQGFLAIGIHQPPPPENANAYKQQGSRNR